MEETKTKKIWSIINWISFSFFILAITLILLAEAHTYSNDYHPYNWFGGFAHSHFWEIYSFTWLTILSVMLVGWANCFVKKNQSLKKTLISIFLIVTCLLLSINLREDFEDFRKILITFTVTAVAALAYPLVRKKLYNYSSKCQ